MICFACKAAGFLNARGFPSCSFQTPVAGRSCASAPRRRTESDFFSLVSRRHLHLHQVLASAFAGECFWLHRSFRLVCNGLKPFLASQHAWTPNRAVRLLRSYAEQQVAVGALIPQADLVQSWRPRLNSADQDKSAGSAGEGLTGGGFLAAVRPNRVCSALYFLERGCRGHTAITPAVTSGNLNPACPLSGWIGAGTWSV